MRIVFFDMEFANGKIPGSVYSFGFVQTNERFELTEPQTDLLMNPECEWNDYVKQHILAYPMKTVESAASFPRYYRRIRRLLRRADLTVGFAVQNDIKALTKVCERYRLKPIDFSCLDMERLCRARKDYPEAHGLDGYVRTYCGISPRDRHRSDGDAYATMLLLRELCRRLGLSPQQLAKQSAAHMVHAKSFATPKKTKRAILPHHRVSTGTQDTQAAASAAKAAPSSRHPR